MHIGIIFLITAVRFRPAHFVKSLGVRYLLDVLMKRDNREYIKEILSLLKRKYRAEMHTSLNFGDPWQLLVSTILSAQATDASVNAVTPSLFKRYERVEDFAVARPSDLYKFTRSIGLYKSKSKNIVKAARIIVDRFGSKVPESIDDLVTLPGVGRKTANVVSYNAFGKIQGIAIDTHCVTVANRLGITRSKNPVIIERDLTGVIERKDWGDVTHLFIALGRDVCTARRKYCESCVLNSICVSSSVKQHR